MRNIFGKGAVIIYIISTIFFCNMASKQAKAEQINDTESESFRVSATEVGALCISTVYPSMNIEFADSRDNENSEIVVEDTEVNKDNQDEMQEEAVVTGDSPKVLIIHTHATESYLPSSESNFHSKDEENTVRDVGNYLAQALQEQGISVVHDKTLHDYPSYNSSYSRSYDTVSALLEQYPSIECVIDLHRDAISGESTAATVSVGGKTCAKYSYVVGTSSSTYQSNTAFINGLNSIATENYSGFTGNVIERTYKYNQDLLSRYLLVEIGYNRNQIEDARNTATILGEILAESLKKG